MNRALLLLALSASPAGAQQRPVDWSALTNETVGILAEYIKVNTTVPPGNELQAARFLKRILDKEGIESQILDTAELQPAGRANFYARLKVMAMIAIKRSGMPLTRDIVFIGNADEELGSTGALVFVQRHADLLKDVEFLMIRKHANGS